MAVFDRLFRRGPQLDPAARAVIAAADPGERVVAWAMVPGGRVVVATQRGLWWPVVAGSDGSDAAAPMRRIPWERVDKAVWRDGVLAVTEADVVDDLLLVDREVVALPLDDPGEVPAEVRRRVEGSVLRTEIVPVVGGQVRVVARRVPGRDGLIWWARLEGSTPDNAVVRDQAQAAVTRLRAQTAAQSPA